MGSTYIIHMKAVQVVFDEQTLEQLDSTDEVKQKGRSAVIRMATSEYLRRKRREEIDEQYRKAYADGAGLGEEWKGWEEQGDWPKD